jgi:hypothetical protein
VAGSLLLWGFQGTIDFRTQLTGTQFEALGMTPPTEDRELFVAKDNVERLLDSVRGLGVEVSPAPGGSPLVSALTAQGWARGSEAPLQARFLGAAPPELGDLISPEDAPVIAHASFNPAIGATLALEYRPASAKLMVSVPEGRWLDRRLAEQGLCGLRDAVKEISPSKVALGIGGLNKADPDAVLDLITAARKTAPGCLVYATGSSFAKQPKAERSPSYWSDLRAVYASCDVVSVSADEERQLMVAWGDDWPGALVGRQTKLVVTHSPSAVRTVQSSMLANFLEGLDEVIELAKEEAQRHAVRALTGAGARFDGVLSAALLLRWPPRGI